MKKRWSAHGQVMRVVVGMALVAGALAVAAPPAHAGPANTYYAGDVTVYEGNSGPNSRTFAIPVTLSNRGTGSQVTIDYSIVPVTATNGTAAPADFTAKATGQVKFRLTSSGFTFVKTQIIVKLIADTVVEGNETFEVHLSNAQGGGGYSPGDAVGTVTIVDDDPSSGVVVDIGDVSMVEGDEGNYARHMQFPITLSQPAFGSDVLVTWNVVGPGDVPGSAMCAKAKYGGPSLPGQDCTLFPTNKVTRFKLGVNGTKIALKANVLVFVDTAVEGNETFEVQILSVTGGGGAAVLGDGIGVGTIIDNDVAEE